MEFEEDGGQKWVWLDDGIAISGWSLRTARLEVGVARRGCGLKWVQSVKY